MHYTYERPHKDSNRRVCVLQWWLFPLSSLLPCCCFLTNGPMRKARFVLITFCGATKHQLTFVHKRCTGTLSSRKMLASCSPSFWRPRWNTKMHRRRVCTHLSALRSSRHELEYFLEFSGFGQCWKNCFLLHCWSRHPLPDLSRCYIRPSSSR